MLGPSESRFLMKCWGPRGFKKKREPEGRNKSLDNMLSLAGGTTPRARLQASQAQKLSVAVSKLPDQTLTQTCEPVPGLGNRREGNGFPGPVWGQCGLKR